MLVSLLFFVLNGVQFFKSVMGEQYFSFVRQLVLLFLLRTLLCDAVSSRTTGSTTGNKRQFNFEKIVTILELREEQKRQKKVCRKPGFPIAARVADFFF